MVVELILNFGIILLWIVLVLIRKENAVGYGYF